MPVFTRVNIDYEPYGGESDVFAKGNSSLRDLRPPFKKSTVPKDLTRQQHFERLLELLSLETGRRVPTFVEWNGSVRNRMDKGCIGHAVAAGFLLPPENSADGYVTHIEIA